jgi:hypothetical protein
MYINNMGMHSTEKSVQVENRSVSPTENYVYCVGRSITSKEKVPWYRLITLKAHNCTDK